MEVKPLTKLMHEANELYLKAELFEKANDYDSAKQTYTKVQKLYIQLETHSGIKDSDSSESMRYIAESCRKKIKILDIKNNLLPKYSG
jgi:hypothetical protein